MTNTKPTWEDEFNEIVHHDHKSYPSCPAGYDPKEDLLLTALSRCNCQFKDIKAFIQKVEQEAGKKAVEQAKTKNAQIAQTNLKKAQEAGIPVLKPHADYVQKTQNRLPEQIEINQVNVQSPGKTWRNEFEKIVIEENLDTGSEAVRRLYALNEKVEQEAYERGRSNGRAEAGDLMPQIIYPL